MHAVARLVPFDLGTPVRAIRGRDARSRAPAVAVPETPMHEHHFSTPNEHQVRFARQIGPMQSERYPLTSAPSGDDDSRTGVLAAHQLHDLRAPCGAYGVQVGPS